MKYQPPLLLAIFLRRYKRFLADVLLDGERVTVHCPNTGSMRHCLEENSPCWLFDAQRPGRKTRYTWELATTPFGLAGINTHRANQLVEEAIHGGVITELRGYETLQREVAWGDKSRVDFLLSGSAGRCFVEVKSVTLAMGEGLGLFPDAKSARALKHIGELERVVQQGDRGVLLFCVQHTGIERVAPAVSIDPIYSAALAKAASRGVEVIAYRAQISPECSYLEYSVSVLWS